MVSREQKERQRSSRDTLGKFFFDIAKLTFAAMVLGGVVALITGEGGDSGWLLMLVGLAVTSIFAYIGYYILKH